MIRRAHAAARAYFDENASFVVACGGRPWDGVVEADALAKLLVGEGVPESAIVREDRSWDTFENAAGAAPICADKPVVLVTCTWHLRRARLIFERAQVRVIRGVGAPPPRASLIRRAWRTTRERLFAWKDLRR